MDWFFANLSNNTLSGYFRVTSQSQQCNYSGLMTYCLVSFSARTGT